MKKVLFACGEPSCPRTGDQTAQLSSRRVHDVSQALSDRPVCSTCETPMGVYDVVETESECECVKEEKEGLQEDGYGREEERIQQRASDRYRRAASA